MVTNMKQNEEKELQYKPKSKVKFSKKKNKGK